MKGEVVRFYICVLIIDIFVFNWDFNWFVSLKWNYLGIVKFKFFLGGKGLVIDCLVID